MIKKNLRPSGKRPMMNRNLFLSVNFCIHMHTNSNTPTLTPYTLNHTYANARVPLPMIISFMWCRIKEEKNKANKPTNTRN